MKLIRRILVGVIRAPVRAIQWVYAPPKRPRPGYFEALQYGDAAGLGTDPDPLQHRRFREYARVQEALDVKKEQEAKRD